MSAGALLKAWLPPAISNVLRSRRGRYATYAEALAACATQGYGDDVLANTVARKTAWYAKSLTVEKAVRVAGPFELQLLSALMLSLSSASRSADRQVIRVLDFGGACASGYFAIRTLLPAGVDLQWTVVETPTMAAAGRKYFGENSSLRFISDLAELGSDPASQFDLLYSSCALPFTPDPTGFLNRLLALDIPNIAFTRLILTEHAEPFSIVFKSSLSANGPAVPQAFGDDQGSLPPDAPLSYPCTFMSRAEVERSLARRYQILFAAADANAVVPVLGRATVGMSYFGRRIDSGRGVDA